MKVTGRKKPKFVKKDPEGIKVVQSDGLTLENIQKMNS